MRHFRGPAYWSVAFWVGCLLCLFPQPASAYLDPGTGSMLWQVLLAGGLALAYLIKRYWSRIRRLFSRHPADGERDKRDGGQT